MMIRLLAIIGLLVIGSAMRADAQLGGVLLAPQQATGAITATPILTLNGNSMTLNGSAATK